MLPREKLEKFGLQSLDNSDLIAVILGHGNKNENVFNLSKRLLNEYGPNPLLSINKMDELSQYFNIGRVQSAKLISCIELGRRLFEVKSRKQVKISNPNDVFVYMKPLFDFNKEYIYGIYLNTRNYLIHEEVLSIGSLESSSVHIRDIFYPAFINNAYSFILVHNHPSEDPNPSEEDINFTKEVEKAANTLQVPFLDHIIITKSAFFSFNENYQP